ncbi:uncharacterized protein EV422DRAFT_514653 [Fimicolochytrium jonesii]|uniref:uncharacterized protein n=1 Tax=Fimicolochytrium jonesii TaxID=1396493 RepID=UPI0022FF056D|nr:uncharacterized protein EV422DRAFT_514653 [Fimicolochytrium jonesii]KAI8825916.1 hypothetical protein EV422DRAFT_514653 [Fimicolochytrium jonesii]
MVPTLRAAKSEARFGQLGTLVGQLAQKTGGEAGSPHNQMFRQAVVQPRTLVGGIITQVQNDAEAAAQSPKGARKRANTTRNDKIVEDIADATSSPQRSKTAKGKRKNSRMGEDVESTPADAKTSTFQTPPVRRRGKSQGNHHHRPDQLSASSPAPSTPQAGKSQPSTPDSLHYTPFAETELGRVHSQTQPSNETLQRHKGSRPRGQSRHSTTLDIPLTPSPSTPAAGVVGTPEATRKKSVRRAQDFYVYNAVKGERPAGTP